MIINYLNNTNKSVVIVGAGPAGLAAAYRLVTMSEGYDITMIDEGYNIYVRRCPVREGKACANCKPCHITHGFGGSGTFSDCKLSLSPFEVGGNISEYVKDVPKLLSYAADVERFFEEFDVDASSRVTLGTRDSEYKEIEETLKNKAGITLIYNPTKHIGTDGTLKVMKLLYEYLVNKGVKFRFNTKVTGIDVIDHYKCVKMRNNKESSFIFTENVIFAVGRSGNEELGKMLYNELGIKSISDRCDIGVRVEMPAGIIQELTDKFYDVKLTRSVKVFGFDRPIKVRTFCVNPSGYVSEEHYNDGTVLANGHSYADKKSDMTNFALLCTLPLSAKDGKDMLNRFLAKSNGKLVVDTYKNCADRVRDYMPKNCTLGTATDQTKLYGITGDFTNIVLRAVDGFLEYLNMIYPGCTAPTTNLYAPEAKFYSNVIPVNENLETEFSGIFVGGDGSGITRGIVQSAISGFVIADAIIERNA